MPTPISDSSAMYARLEEVLGPKHAETLMTYLPPEPGAEMATKADVAVLEHRFDRLEELLDRRFEQIDQRFEQIDQRFEQIDGRLDRMDRRFETMDDRMYGLQDVIRDQLRTYTVTMVGGMTALTAIYAALLTFIA
ncbi:MAG: hypothetical protein ABFR89_05810 [Actinomycetota bacterium]